MRRAHSALVLVFIGVMTARAQTVVSNSNLSLVSPALNPGSNLAITVWQNAAATNPTSTNFIFNGSQVRYINSTSDEGSDWYLVHLGDRFDPSTIESGAYPVIAASLVTFGVGDVGTSDFYLGTSTGEGFDLVMGAHKGRRTAFGWVHLQPAAPGSTTLVMLGNAMSYDSPGIIVGTTTLVPEPAYVSLALTCGMAGAMWRRHRK